MWLRPPASLLPLLVLLTAPVLAHADPTFTEPVAGDWFDGSSWSHGTAPTATDDPVIDNGGKATAASDSPFYPGGGVPISVGDLSIGARHGTGGPVIGIVDAAGALDVAGLDLDASGLVRVGVNETPDGSAYAGSLAVTSGSLTGMTRMIVGQSASDTDADGSVSVTGDLVPYMPPVPSGFPILYVGDSRGGNVQGHLDVGGHMDGFSTVSIGAGIGGIGDAARVDADVSIGGNMVSTGGSLVIAQASGGPTDGSAPGFDVTGSLTVGGDLTGYSDLRTFGNEAILVGWGASAGSADGTLVVGGDVVAPMGERLTLSAGGARDSGTSSGSVRIGGALVRGTIEAGFIERSFSSGATAIGDVEVGSIIDGGASLGVAPGDGLAIGRLHVRGDIAASQNPTSTSRIVVARTSDHPGARAFGRLLVDGSISGGAAADIYVGSSTDGLGMATGSVQTEGIGGAARLFVGHNRGGSAPAGLATGSLRVGSGGISADGGGSKQLLVGWAKDGGSAVGVVDVRGDVGPFPVIDVGVVGAGTSGTGTADGALSVHDGALTGGTLRVGVTEAGGGATGYLHLDRALAQLDGGLELGDGATLELGIDGTTRGTRYGAIDAPTALLDGILRLSFSTTPAAGTAFDLIVSETADGITGAFDVVEILGVDPALIRLGVELIPTVLGPVEAFRARVVPEPGVGLLLGVGLGLLGVARRRSGSRRTR